jgi:4-amino-4-deoxy-L-arabinose transferase-like glycosyltransferase
VRRPVLTLILLASVTFFLGLGRQAITDSDEGFYAEAAREMVEGGDWLTPHFNYEERWQKPVLYYWVTAATFLATGPTEYAARWWSAASGVGLVLITWIAARRMTRRDDTAWLAGAIVATCYGCFAMARMALPDLPLALFITLTIWSALEGRWALAGATAGMGFLMKGPLALVIPAIVLLPIWWREGRLGVLTLRNLSVAAALFAVIGLPWYGAMTYAHGTAYLESFFVADNLERFATDRFNEPRAFWFYVPILLGGLLPWSLFIFVMAPSAWDVVKRRRRLTPEEWRLLLWIGVPLLFFTLSVGKQPRYILPVLPPMAILVARAIIRRIRDPRAYGAIAIATWATALLFAILAVLLIRARPLFVTAFPTVSLLAIALIGGATLALAYVPASRRWHLLPGHLAVCSAGLMAAVQFGALAGVRPEPVEQMATLVAHHRTAGESVGTYEVFVRNLVFYTRFKTTDLFDEGRALDFLKSPDRHLLVVRASDLPRLEAISGTTTRRLGQVRYLNTANIRLRTLLAPIPEQDLETVVLVANR